MVPTQPDISNQKALGAFLASRALMVLGGYCCFTILIPVYWMPIIYGQSGYPGDRLVLAIDLCQPVLDTYYWHSGSIEDFGAH